MGTDKIKKVVIWLIVAFVAYAIFRSPARAADTVNGLWEALKTGITNIGTFFNGVLNR